MQKKTIWKILFFIVLTPRLGYGAKPEYKFSNISISEETLTSHFEVKGLFDREIIRGIQKGMTAALEYQVQLWKERRHWVDHLRSQKVFRTKINYDNWQKQYVLIHKDTTMQAVNEDTLIQRYSKLSHFAVTGKENLKQGEKYYITVKVVLRPISIENYEEIKRWLSGEVSEIRPKNIATRSPGKRAGEWMFGLFRNVTGFGDRVIIAKSPTFEYNGTNIKISNHK